MLIKIIDAPVQHNHNKHRHRIYAPLNNPPCYKSKNVMGTFLMKRKIINKLTHWGIMNIISHRLTIKNKT